MTEFCIGIKKRIENPLIFFHRVYLIVYQIEFTRKNFFHDPIFNLLYSAGQYELGSSPQNV